VNNDVLVSSQDASSVDSQSLVFASMIFLVTLMLIATSILTIVVIWSNETLHDAMGYYMTSLAISDLISGICFFVYL
jgi:hypothetical protein